MATGETGFGGVTFDLISVQHHSVTSGRDYRPARGATRAGLNGIASRPAMRTPVRRIGFRVSRKC